MNTTAEHERREATASLPERLLVSALAVGVVAVLFALRRLDDNRLVSWSFVLAGRSPAGLFGLVALAAGVAQLAVRVRLPAGRTGVHLFLAAVAVALPFWRAPEMIVDAARYFTQAKHVAALGVGGFVAGWGSAFSAWTDLPLVPFLQGFALAALGESRAVTQGVSTLLFGLTAVVTWRIGKILFGEEVGAAAGALLLAIPYLLVQAPALLVDVPTMFFVALATWVSIEALARGGWRWTGLAAVAVAAAALSKYSAWVLLTVVPVAAVVIGRPLSLDPSPPLARGRGDEATRGRGERRRGGGRVALTFVVIVLGGAVLLAAALLPFRDTVVEQIRLLAAYQAPGLRRWGESFLSTFLFQAHPFLAAGAIASAWLAVRRRDPRWLVAAWPVLVLLVLQVRRARYWIPAFPSLALLAAYGLHALRSREVRRLAVATAVAVSLVVALFGYLPFLRRASLSNLQAAGRYLDALPEAEAVVFASGAPGAPGSQVNPAVSVPLLDLHTRKRLVYRDPRAPAPSGVETSALRFTWEHRTPAWYGGEAGAGAAVVVVSDELEAPLPPEAAGQVAGMRLAATFAADEGVFAYRTLVRVYRVPPLP